MSDTVCDAVIMIVSKMVRWCLFPTHCRRVGCPPSTMVPHTMKQTIALCVHVGSPLFVVLQTVRIGHVLPMKHFRSRSTCACKKIFVRYGLWISFEISTSLGAAYNWGLMSKLRAGAPNDRSWAMPLVGATTYGQIPIWTWAQFLLRMPDLSPDKSLVKWTASPDMAAPIGIQPLSPMSGVLVYHVRYSWLSGFRRVERGRSR